MTEDPRQHVTMLLDAIAEGSQGASAELLPLVYGELRRLADVHLRQESPGHTLQATALVHEAYLKLVGASEPWRNRSHFFGAAAIAMRRLLVDHARARAASKRGGGAAKVAWDDGAMPGSPEAARLDLLALDEALDRLEQAEPRRARVVLLRYFAGLSIEETATVMDCSATTVKSDWSYARAWLHRELSP